MWYLLLFLILLLFFSDLSVTTQKPKTDLEKEEAQCVEDLKKALQSYRNLYKTLYNRDMTQEEWENFKKQINLTTVKSEGRAGGVSRKSRNSRKS